MDFVEICNVYIEKMIIKAAKRIFNSDKICRSYSNLNFGVTFWNTVYFFSCTFFFFYVLCDCVSGQVMIDIRDRLLLLPFRFLADRLSCANCRQVVHILYMFLYLSSSSITWYWTIS